jgi:hypothetical protein
MSTIIQSNKTEAFWTMVKQELTAEQYELIPRTTEIPLRRLAFMADPDRGVGTMSAREIEVFANLLKKDVGELIMDYGCGSNKLTIDDANQIAHPRGYSIGLVAHVA